MNNKKNKTLILVLVITLLVVAVGMTFAYFSAQVGSGTSVDVTVTTKTTDLLTFNKGNNITINATQANFYQGAGNLNGSTNVSATLVANNATNSATETYNVYLNITVNDFVYTTAPTNTPELLLTITNPNNQAVTSITGLTYTTVGGVSGFDITTKTGLIQIADDYTITSSGTQTDTWNITVTLVNLSSDQEANTGKTFTASAIIQQDEIEIELPADYWNDNFGGHTYNYPNPSTAYPSLAQLQSNYADFAINPIYIKTTSTEYQACLYYNNHEFCLQYPYWDTDETTTLTKLQTDMESKLGTSANVDGCGTYTGEARCNFGNFYCAVTQNENVSCGSFITEAWCQVRANDRAYCEIF